jgi:hypothetical protein
LYLARTAGFRRRLVVDVSVVVVVADIVARLSDFDCQDSLPRKVAPIVIARLTTQFADSPSTFGIEVTRKRDSEGGFLIVALDRVRSSRTDDSIDKSSPS